MTQVGRRRHESDTQNWSRMKNEKKYRNGPMQLCEKLLRCANSYSFCAEIVSTLFSTNVKNRVGSGQLHYLIVFVISALFIVSTVCNVPVQRMFARWVKERCLWQLVCGSVWARILLTALNWADECDITIYRRRRRASDFFDRSSRAVTRAVSHAVLYRQQTINFTPKFGPTSTCCDLLRICRTTSRTTCWRVGMLGIC